MGELRLTEILRMLPNSGAGFNDPTSHTHKKEDMRCAVPSCAIVSARGTETLTATSRPFHPSLPSSAVRPGFVADLPPRVPFSRGAPAGSAPWAPKPDEDYIRNGEHVTNSTYRHFLMLKVPLLNGKLSGVRYRYVRIADCETGCQS